MPEQENIQSIREVYAAFKRGDVPAILEHFTEDIVWQTPVPPHVPYAGQRFGREQVAEFFRIHGENVEVLTFEPREFIAQGDQVAALGTHAGRARSTGREFATDFVMVFTFRNGKVSRFREYLDTGAVGSAWDRGAIPFTGNP